MLTLNSTIRFFYIICPRRAGPCYLVSLITYLFFAFAISCAQTPLCPPLHRAEGHICRTEIDVDYITLCRLGIETEPGVDGISIHTHSYICCSDSACVLCPLLILCLFSFRRSSSVSFYHPWFWHWNLKAKLRCHMSHNPRISSLRGITATRISVTPKKMLVQWVHFRSKLGFHGVTVHSDAQAWSLSVTGICSTEHSPFYC